MEGPLYGMLISSRSVDKHGRHKQFLFLIGSFLKNLSETALPNESTFGRKIHLKVLDENCLFNPDLLTNMAAIGNSCFWLVDF